MKVAKDCVAMFRSQDAVIVDKVLKLIKSFFIKTAIKDVSNVIRDLF